MNISYTSLMLIKDLRFALRNLARTPGFSITCTLVLSVGIAVSTAAFAIVNTLVRHPVPFPNPDRLALLNERNAEKGFLAGVSYPLFTDWRTRSRVLEEAGAFEAQSFNLSGAVEPESVRGALATSGFFHALGWNTVLGRQFVAEDEQPGAPRVVMISERCWERRFGSDPGIVGRMLVVDGEQATIVGVLARIIGRSYYASYDVWAPLTATTARASREARTLGVVALLKPGMSFAQAGADLDAIARSAAEPTRASENWGAAIAPMAQTTRHVVPMYVLLVAVVGLLLLIVCANIATLQLARAAGRQAEIAVRMALGASRIRIIAHLLSEGVLLGSTSGILGYLLTAGVRSLVVASVPELAELRLDTTVLAFTAMVSIAAGILFGLSPALSLSRPDLNAFLKWRGGSLRSGSGRRVRGLLVVSEMAVAVLLLTGLGLLVRAFVSLHHTDVGFRTRNMVAASIAMPKTYASAAQRNAFLRLAIERLRGLAGVDSAAAVSTMPLGAPAGALKVEIAGRAAAETVRGQYTVATPEYFRTMQIPVRRGRPFGAEDTADAPGSMIVSERAAELLFRGTDPIGQRVRVESGGWRTIVGIVGNARQDLLAAPAPEFYVPHAQDARPAMWMVAGTKSEAGHHGPGVRRELRAIEHDLQISSVTTVDEIISGYFPGALVTGIGVFCAAALFIASLGLYGVISYLVAERTHEFGVRIALGATCAGIAGLVLRQGMKLAGLGAAIGLLGGVGLAKLLAARLVGVEFGHPFVFGSVVAVLSVVALAACYIPARRAMRASPVDAMRCQ